MVYLSLEFVSGGRTDVEVEDGHYVMNGSSVVAFSVYSESDESHDYYDIFTLRTHKDEHHGWLRDATRYVSMGDAGKKFGARQGGIYFGPRGIQPGAAGGLVAGVALAYVLPSVKKHAMDYIREWQGHSGHSYCYVNSHGNEVYWGPVRL